MWKNYGNSHGTLIYTDADKVVILKMPSTAANIDCCPTASRLFTGTRRLNRPKRQIQKGFDKFRLEDTL
jgi:hypothetical protein